MVPEQKTRRIVLAPSYFGRPYNSLIKVGEITLVCYPIADSALGAGGRAAPPVATLRLYRALGDESRLRILRLLAERDRYLTELATELDLSKPTVSHHLAQLRSGRPGDYDRTGQTSPTTRFAGTEPSRPDRS